MKDVQNAIYSIAETRGKECYCISACRKRFFDTLKAGLAARFQLRLSKKPVTAKIG